MLIIEDIKIGDKKHDFTFGVFILIMCRHHDQMMCAKTQCATFQETKHYLVAN